MEFLPSEGSAVGWGGLRSVYLWPGSEDHLSDGVIRSLPRFNMISSKLNLRFGALLVSSIYNYNQGRWKIWITQKQELLLENLEKKKI